MMMIRSGGALSECDCQRRSSTPSEGGVQILGSVGNDGTKSDSSQVPSGKLSRTPRANISRDVPSMVTLTLLSTGAIAANEEAESDTAAGDAPPASPVTPSERLRKAALESRLFGPVESLHAARDRTNPANIGVKP